MSFNFRNSSHIGRFWNKLLIKKRNIQSHIREKSEKPLICKYKGKPRHWIVERTNSWHNRFRAILIRWDIKSENYLASLYLASSIITLELLKNSIIKIRKIASIVHFNSTKANQELIFQKLFSTFLISSFETNSQL